MTSFYITTLHTKIFIDAPSVERLPTKAISHEMRISSAGHQPSISWSQGEPQWMTTSNTELDLTLC